MLIKNKNKRALHVLDLGCNNSGWVFKGMFESMVAVDFQSIFLLENTLK